MSEFLQSDWRAGPVLARTEGGTLLVTLNRPQARNALDAETMGSLRRLWREVAGAEEIRCVVVSGADPAFCAGADVSLLASDRADAAETAAEELSFLPGAQLEVPVIAAVNGACAGGGLHFVADSDIAIAAEQAYFIDPHVSVGQVTALEPLTLRLRMRPDILARMVLLGRNERLSASEAQAAGLVSEVVPAPLLRERALELAGQVADSSPAALRRSRRVLRDFEASLLGDWLDVGWSEVRAHWDHPDAKEGPAAFAARRAPRWRDG